MSETCACVHDDALLCAVIRYGVPPSELRFLGEKIEPCDCPCHDPEDCDDDH